LITREQHIQNIEAFFAECVATARRKNQDYCGAGPDADPFKNFRLVERLGITTTAKGILVRMCDKMARISSLIDGADAAVKDESIEDTLHDVANYAAILVSLKKEAKQ
jgi:hypothetical protein